MEKEICLKEYPCILCNVGHWEPKQTVCSKGYRKESVIEKFARGGFKEENICTKKRNVTSVISRP